MAHIAWAVPGLAAAAATALCLGFGPAGPAAAATPAPAVPTAAPGHTHAGHDAGAGHTDTGTKTPPAGNSGHDGHGGGGAADPTSGTTKAAVLGGFAAVNAAVIGTAYTLRRRGHGPRRLPSRGAAAS